VGAKGWLSMDYARHADAGNPSIAGKRRLGRSARAILIWRMSAQGPFATGPAAGPRCPLCFIRDRDPAALQYVAMGHKPTFKHVY
jgi:hypothetical protein